MKKGLAIAGMLMMFMVMLSFSRQGDSRHADVRAGLRTSVVREHAAFPDTTYPSFLVISDIHLHSEGDQSPSITTNSDTGKDLWDSAQTKIRSVLTGKAGVAKPKFIVYLGDLPWHTKDSTQVPDAMENAGKVLADLRGLAREAQIPLLYVPGNNDSPEGDYGPFSAGLFREDSAGMKDWPVIGGSPLDTSAWSLGCYSAAPLKGHHSMLVLVLNTNIFTSRYGRMTGKTRQTADADKELQWLARQLRTAAAAHRHVLIAMHVPPGKDAYLPADSNRETCTGTFKNLWDPSILLQRDGHELSAQDEFLDLVGAWRHSIVGLIGSHTHFDGLRMLTDRKKNYSALLVSAPGIAPGHGNNPGFKIICYDPKNSQLTGFISFYNNFFPDRTVKTWGDLFFRFGKIIPNKAPVSLFEKVKSMPLKDLRKRVNSFYMLYNGDGYGMGNCVDTTLFVHYQP